jgi:hypothetical protein
MPEASKGYSVYAAAKTEGERTAWKWNEDTNPGFILNTILPNYNVRQPPSIRLPELSSNGHTT